MAQRTQVLKIVLWGEPLAKARPKGQLRGRHVHIYTPTSDAERAVAAAMIEYRGAMLHADRVQVAMVFHGAHGGKDLDNMAKLYLDAMVKAKVIRDDNSRRVSRLLLEAMPLTEYGEPRVVIHVEAI